MDERSIFHRFHSALEVEPPAGSFERLRAALTRRRSRSRAAGIGWAAVVAVILAGGVLAIAIGYRASSQRQPAPATAGLESPGVPEILVPPGPGSDVAWLITQEGNEPRRFVGIDPAGNRVGQIQSTRSAEGVQGEISWRSPDGSRLYGVSRAVLQVISAVSGSLLKEVPLQVGSRPAAAGLSPDGRRMVLASSFSDRVEVIDLLEGRSLATGEIAVPQTHSGLTWVVVGSDARRAYLVTENSVTTLAIEGSQVSVAGTRATGGRDGRRVLECNSPSPPSFRLRSAERVLVVFCPQDGRVWWVDLDRLEALATVTVTQRYPFDLDPLFAPDGRSLYLYDPASSGIHVVDLERRTVSRQVPLPRSVASPIRFLSRLLIRDVEAKEARHTAALSPDGQWLYVSQDRESGVFRFHLPELRSHAEWLPGVRPRGLWLSGDGRTLYVLGETGTVLYVLDTDGKQRATAGVRTTYGFVAAP